MTHPAIADAEALLEERLFATVAATAGTEIAELARRLHAQAAAARADGAPADALLAAVAGLDASTAGVVAKALLLRLQLANLGEERERVRRLDAAPSPFPALDGALTTPADERLADLHVEIVLTMHPSDATRRAVIHKLQRLGDLLDERDRAHGAAGRADTLAAIDETIGAWWATDEVRRNRPPVEEEVRRTVFLVETALYDAAADVAMALERRLVRPPAGPPISFAQWAGGDMDGNPSASAATVRFAVLEARRSAIRLLRDRVVQASRLHSEAATPHSALAALIARDAEELPGGRGEADAYAHEPLRRALRLMRDRLTWSLRALDGDVAVEPAWTYRDDAVLVDDLRAIRDACSGPAPSLDRLIWQARIFGLHLLEIDVRLHAREIREAVDALHPAAALLEGHARRAAVVADLAHPTPADPAAETPRAADVIAEVGRLRAAFGAMPLRSLVISGCEDAAEVIDAIWLLRSGGIEDVPVVPLFESSASLRNAAAIADDLLTEPMVRAHVAATGDRLEVMLGHSDGGKDEGLLSAQWRIWRAQEDLVEACERHGVGFRAFHGRGGSPARGAAPGEEIASALPAGAARGGLRLTEQGEAARAKLAHPVLARRALDQVLAGAVAAATRGADVRAPQAWRDEIERLAERSATAWRALLDDPEFPAVFERTTPIALADDLKLGSRPARRSASSPASLRAIPWVMAWTQTRMLVPGWYGAGTALLDGDPAIQRAMRERWPPFRVIVSALEAALFRSDPLFADAYARLDPSPAAARIWTEVRAEYDRTLTAVARITGDETVYARRPALGARRDARNAWIDPLSAIQVELLRRRANGDDAVHEALLTTMAGVAAGVQSVG